MMARLKICMMVLFWVGVGVTLAQPAECPAIVDAAFEALEDNCTELDRNTACYGYSLVSADFTEAVETDFFSQPADVTNLDILREINTAAMDESRSVWGVAVMKVQANVPDTIPGQAVTFVLFGDVEMRSATSPGIGADAEPLPVVTATDANIRTGPTFSRNIIGVVTSGTELVADGQSQNGDWLRVVYNEVPAWVNTSVLAADAGFAALPVVEGVPRSPMQAFYLSTGIGAPGCAEAPDDQLLIQGPENIKIELTINGVDIRLGSTVSVTAENGQLKFTVLDGELEILSSPYNPQPIFLPAGATIFAPISQDEAGNPVQNGNWSPIDYLQTFELGEYCTLRQTPLGALIYKLDLSCEEDDLRPPRIIDNSGQPQSDDDFTASAEEPCPGFQIVGPVGQAESRRDTYEWTAVPDATRYEVVFINYLGNFAGSVFVDAPATSATIDVIDFPTGSDFQWEVRAYGPDGYLCVTPRSETVFKLADPDAVLVTPEPEPDEAFVVTLDCSVNDLVQATWSGAAPTGVTYVVEVFGDPFDSGVLPGESGTQELNTDFGTRFVFRSDGKDTITLGQKNCNTGT